jgi:Gpi18-like mannosyltransferase
LAGALLSTLFLGLALFYLDKLMDTIWLYEDQKYFVYILLLVFPGSFFFSLVYSESLFLFLSVIFFYNLFKKNYFWASIFLSLATLTRAVGLLLIVPFIYYLFASERYNKKFNFISKSLTYLALVLSPLIVFYYYLFERTGDFFAAIKAQQAVHDFLFIPFGYFFDLFNNLGQEMILGYVLNAVVLVSALVLVGYLFVRVFLILEYKTIEQNTLFVYALVYILMLSSLSSSSTMFRYLSVCLPLFLLPASIFYSLQVRSKWFFMLSFAFLSLQTLFFIMFLTGIPAYVY